MDVVFHRNCMDGAYSAHLMYLFCRTLSPKGHKQLLVHLQSHTTNQLLPLQSQQILVSPCQQITQQFFHSKPEVPFHGVSMFAGDLFPIAPSTPGNILFLLDISPNTKEMIVSMASRFLYVVIVDHHTTFANCKQFILEAGLKNVLYLWNQAKCAAQLVYDYLFQSFGFPKNLPKQYRESLEEQIEHVAGNDLKIKQSKASKQFTLGFYYFQIELNHQNPLLYKRIWQLNMETVFTKGQRIYKEHIECLIRAIQHCEVYSMVKSKFKGISFLAAEMGDRGLTSDLGSILAYLSTKHKFQNLAMIYNKGSSQCRISFRSCQTVDKKPMALQISEFYGGGGHVCAAGCFVDKNTFKQHFKREGPLKPPVTLSKKQVQDILFKGATF